MSVVLSWGGTRDTPKNVCVGGYPANSTSVAPSVCHEIDFLPHDRGRVCTTRATPTTESRNMAAILQIVG